MHFQPLSTSRHANGVYKVSWCLLQFAMSKIIHNLRKAYHVCPRIKIFLCIHGLIPEWHHMCSMFYAQQNFSAQTASRISWGLVRLGKTRGSKLTKHRSSVDLSQQTRVYQVAFFLTPQKALRCADVLAAQISTWPGRIQLQLFEAVASPKKHLDALHRPKVISKTSSSYPLLN